MDPVQLTAARRRSAIVRAERQAERSWQIAEWYGKRAAAVRTNLEAMKAHELMVRWVLSAWENEVLAHNPWVMALHGDLPPEWFEELQAQVWAAYPCPAQVWRAYPPPTLVAIPPALVHDADCAYEAPKPAQIAQASVQPQAIPAWSSEVYERTATPEWQWAAPPGQGGSAASAESSRFQTAPQAAFPVGTGFQGTPALHPEYEREELSGQGGLDPGDAAAVYAQQMAYYQGRHGLYMPAPSRNEPMCQFAPADHLQHSQYYVYSANAALPSCCVCLCVRLTGPARRHNKDRYIESRCATPETLASSRSTA